MLGRQEIERERELRLSLGRPQTKASSEAAAPLGSSKWHTYTKRTRRTIVCSNVRTEGRTDCDWVRPHSFVRYGGLTNEGKGTAVCMS